MIEERPWGMPSTQRWTATREAMTPRSGRSTTALPRGSSASSSSTRAITRRSTDDESATQLLVALDAPADQVAIAKEVAARLSEELAKLPENQRVAFELIKQDGLSVAEAAQTLGTTVAAVKLRAHRAYEALREALAEMSPPSSRGQA